MKRLLLAALLTAVAAPAAAQTRDYGQALTVRIWDNRTAPHSNGITGTEYELYPDCITATTDAELYIFPAEPSKATGQAIVLCPGGGYECICIEHEGYLAARWLARNGITAAILKYRLPNGHPEVPLEDAQQALRILQGLEPGAEGYTAPQVGIAGFSAGGHLAAMTSTMAELKPAFTLLFYPVITAEAGKGHQGSFDNLLGERRNDRTDAYYSLQNRVTRSTPPAILLLSDDDGTVPPINSTLYYDALKACGIEASMHIYPTGEHGWGVREGFPYQPQWQQAVLDWLKKREPNAPSDRLGQAE